MPFRHNRALAINLNGGKMRAIVRFAFMGGLSSLTTAVSYLGSHHAEELRWEETNILESKHIGVLLDRGQLLFCRLSEFLLDLWAKMGSFPDICLIHVAHLHCTSTMGKNGDEFRRHDLGVRSHINGCSRTKVCPCEIVPGEYRKHVDCFLYLETSTEGGHFLAHLLAL